MTEASIQGHGSAKRLLAHTPFSSVSHCPSRTPRFTNASVSRRLVASTRASRKQPEEEEHDYAGLLKKTWKIFSLSPLYKFKPSKVCLTKYERSLDVAFSQVKTQGWSTETFGNEKTFFSLYEGLNFNHNDAQAVQIQVVEKSDSGGQGSIVLNALLICVDLDGSPVPDHLSNSFTYYPVILISGNKARTDVLLNWLEQHFDCQTSHVCFSNNDLRWMLGMWSSQAVAMKAFPVLLQYSLADLCDGISTIDCKFEAAFCSELWERLNGSAFSREAVNEAEVNKFVTALEEHLEYTMHIMFSKLCLSEVGTSVAYVSSQGKLKLFSNSGVFPALHLICEIVKDRFQDIHYTLT
ncbi:unnamed protein product [Candidula unifasciata]|uniref:Centromere protein L n=1 Tax=Candidula unifasciata TaxID=100452 RepID=A0A8S3YL92_9EUPU|nr:unnamed protein product [Candidula unifasciata]